MAKLTREIVWKYIKGLGRDVTAQDLRRDFDMTPWGARYHLSTLCRMRALKRLGKTCDSHYKIVRPNADVGDRRGTNKNSLDNLRHVMRAKANSPGRNDKPRKDWAQATELDKCWGFGSVSLDTGGGAGLNSPREGAPKENASETPA